MTVAGSAGGGGSASAPANYIADFAEFERRWRAADDGYAIMSSETYVKPAGAGLPMRFLDTAGRVVVVRR